MKKKVRIIIAIFILSFSFPVNAEVLLELDCNSKSIVDDKNVTCEGYLSYEQEKINDIEIEYDTKLNVEFRSVDNFKLSKNDNKISIHTDEALYDEIMNSTKIFDVIISPNNNISTEEELILKNIKINNNDELVVDNVKETFSISFPDKVEELDSNCLLDSISIDNEVINNFNKEQLEYKNIVVDKEKIFIDAVRSSSKSSVTGLGEVIVNKGESIVRDITVTAENGNVKVYKLYITSSIPKEVVKSNNNNLKSLELYNGNEIINFDYDSTKNTFNIEVDDFIEKISIKAALDDDKATFVKNYGSRDISLKYGVNKVLLKVKAENGEEKVYTLNITRKDNRSNDNSLFYLFVNGKEIMLSDELYDYEIVLPHDVNKTEIKAMANSEKATIKYEDIELSDVDNDISITVTSESGKEQEYDVNIVREEEKKEEIIFEKFEVAGYDIGFLKDKHSYTIRLNKETDELDIKVIPSNIDVEVLNNKKLQNGSVVVIKINDSNGEYEYTINIEKDSIILDIICYSVFGIGFISLIMSIIYVKKRKS